MRSRTTMLAILLGVAIATMPLSAAASTASVNAAHLANLKTRGAAEITRRLTSLNAAAAKIADAAKLSANDKSALATQVQNEISGLTALAAKLAADTDLATARTDVAAIVTDYRVYALLLPKAMLVSSADRLGVAHDNLAALAAKLQTKITTLKAAGKDVTALQASLTDMTARLAAAEGLYSGMSDKIIGLTASDFNADHTVLAGDRTQLGTARSDLAAALADAQTIIAGIKTLTGATASPSVSPSVSPSPTVSPSPSASPAQ